MKDEANRKSVFVQLREKLDLTQKQVAESLAISEQTVRNWEHGRTVPQLTIPQVKRLCNLLNCSVYELPDYFGPVDESQEQSADDVSSITSASSESN